MARGKDYDKSDDFTQMAMMVTISVLALLALLWFLKSQWLVYYSSPGLRNLALPWFLWDKPTWAAINEALVFYRQSPAQVDFVSYIKYVNICLMPLAYVLCLAFMGMAALRFRKKTADAYRRKITPEALMRQISGTFTNIIPVIHLGPSLMKNKLPKWRRQTFAEDVWMNERVSGLPIAVGAHIFEDRVKEYFWGGPLNQTKGGRRWSRMLGFLCVNLAKDADDLGKKSFSDRFSPEGKVLLGMLAAQAFGGRDGKQDYIKAKDQLNRTTAGQENGIPNLTVAQWVYDKYKDHSDVAGLFRVHHWEYSYLFSLFLLAKKNGKVTHTDWLWLKPTNRVMFYALNTVGRSTPPVEAATAFSQYGYERKVYKKGWLPLAPGEDRAPILGADGLPIQHIMIDGCVKDFIAQFNAYQNKTEGNEKWWRKNLEKGEDDEGVKQSMARYRAETTGVTNSLANVPAPEKTEFDLQMDDLAAKNASPV